VRKLEKVVVVNGSRGATENRAAGLTARRCDVGVTSTWFEAALFDVNGSPDLPYIFSTAVFRCSSSLVLILRRIFI